MKLGIVGAGNVGCSCAFAAVKRGSVRKISPVNRTRKTAEAVATDIRYGSVLCPPVTIADGDYDALKGTALVMITSGVNDKTGGATERSDPQGRLRLLGKNAEIYRDNRAEDRARSARYRAAAERGGREGVSAVPMPELSVDGRKGREKTAENLKEGVGERVRRMRWI